MANRIEIIVTTQDKASAPLEHIQATAQTVSASVTGSLGHITTASVAMGTALGQVFVQAAEKTIAVGKQLITGYTEQGAQIEILHQRTGISAQGLSELGYAAKLSGTNLEGLEIGTRKLATELVNAAHGSKPAIEGLQALGLKVNDFKGLNPDQIFGKFLGALANVSDDTNKSALAVQFLGRSGEQLLPILAGGADSLAKMRQQANDLGLTFNGVTAAEAKRVNDQIIALKGQFTGLGYAIGRDLLPLVSEMTGKFSEWISQNGATIAEQAAAAFDDMAKAAHGVETALEAIVKFNGTKVAMQVIVDLLHRDFNPEDQAGLGNLGNQLEHPSAGYWANQIAAIAKSPFNLVGALGKEFNAAANWNRAGLGNHETLSDVDRQAALDKKKNGIPVEGPDTEEQLRQLSLTNPYTGTLKPPTFTPPPPFDGGKSPLQSAWDSVLASLNKKLVEAFNDGGAQAAEAVRAHNQEIIGNVGKMAAVVSEQFGIPLENAVTDVFGAIESAEQKLLDATKAWASEFESIHNENLQKQVAAYIKGGKVGLDAEKLKDAALQDRAVEIANKISDALGISVSDLSQRATILGDAFRELSGQMGAQNVSGLLAFVDAKRGVEDRGSGSVTVHGGINFHMPQGANPNQIDHAAVVSDIRKATFSGVQ